MSIKLTENVISRLKNGGEASNEFQPVVQVGEIRVINQSGGEDKVRYRMVLSDGVSTMSGMLAIQLNHLVRSEQLQAGSVIRMNQFSTTLVRGMLLLIVTELDVIHPVCAPIGEQRQSPTAYGSEPPTSMYASAMQSINQPTATMANHQNFIGSSHPGSVPRPNMTANSPIYPHNQDHNAGLHSYGMGNAPNRHSRPVYNQSPPMYNRGPTGKNETALKILPINALNPYQGRWTIKARVTAKAELRLYNNAKGDGKVFSFDLLDASGGEIRVTCFNAVADQFYDQIEAGKVYFISKGSVKPAQKAFNHLKNDHEIMLDSSSTIQPCYDDDGSIPQQQFHFRQIAEIEGLDNNSVLDIIGVVFRIFPSSIVKKKDGTETQKRNLSVKDMSGRSVDVTLWGNFCNTDGQTLQNMCDSGRFPVLAIKSARVGEYNGKNVGTISTSKLLIDPDFPEAHKIKVWFDNGGNKLPSVSLSRENTDIRKTVSQIKEEKLGTSEKADWITVSGNVAFLKADSFYYTACPLTINDRKCNKKVTNNGDGKWRCEKCDKDFDECDYRYILQFQIQDHTGITWVTAFEEGGEAIMGVTAKDLYCMKYEEQDEERFTEIVRNVVVTKYNFKLKVKEETFNDDSRVKITVTKAEKINFSSQTSFLLDMLKKDHPSSLVPMIEMPTAGSGRPNPPTGNFAYKESAPFSNYMGNASSVGRQSATLPASQMGQYGNQYGGSSRLNTTCNSCGAAGHTSMNCPSVVNASGQRVNNMAPEGGRNSGASSLCYKCQLPGHWANACPGVSNATSAYGGGNAAQGRYGSAPRQYVGGY